MPNIRQYSNRMGGPAPDSRASQATFFAGRAVGDSGRAVEAGYNALGRAIGGGIEDLGGAYVKYRTDQDVSRGLAQYATITDTLSQRWDETAKSADPNDPNTAERFRQEELEPVLSKWQEGFTTAEGKKWAQAQAGSLRQHMFEKTAADATRLAGIAAVSNFETFGNRMSSVVQRDPSALNASLGAIDSGVDALVAQTAHLDPTVAARMKGELAQQLKTSVSRAAVVGMADLNPDRAISALQTDQFDSYLSAGEKAQLRAYAEGVKRTKAQEVKSAIAEQKRQQEDFADRASARISAAMIGDDGTTRITPEVIQAAREYSKLPGADPGQVRALANMIDTGVKEMAREAKTPSSDDPATYKNFTSRMSLDKTDPKRLTETEIYEARAAGNITNETMNMLLRARGADDRDAKTPKGAADKRMQQTRNDFLKSLAPVFKPGVDGEGAEGLFARRDYEFTKLVDDIITNQRKRGQTDEQIIAEFFTPTAPHYLGNIAMREYVPKAKDVDAWLDNPGAIPPVDLRRGAAQTMPPAQVAAPARLPGESAAAYLARTK